MYSNQISFYILAKAAVVQLIHKGFSKLVGIYNKPHIYKMNLFECVLNLKVFTKFAFKLKCHLQKLANIKNI